jgi:uncharacterized protein (UPF0548 family)
MWHIRQPAPTLVHDFLAQQQRQAFSYPEVGCSQDSAPAGYTLDHHRIWLGNGQVVFDTACAALRQWRMFPAPLTRIVPADTPIQVDNAVAIIARAWGLWWLNACRIVYVLHEQTPLRRFGFAYGTLPGHVECGEERFSVEWRADDTVWYDIRALSRPRYWLVRLAYPLTRRVQRRFARGSQAAMQQAIAQIAHPTGAGGALS